MSQMWLITVPNNQSDPQTTFAAVQKGVTSGSSGHKVFRIDIPGLVVGTLDSLMSLADELTKIGSQVENAVRKVERQYNEITDSDAGPLRVNETSVEAFLKKFSWDYAQYQFQGRQLSDIVGQIQSMTGKIEEDLKLLSNTFTEKSLALSTTKRKKVINLTTSELEDFLSPNDIARIDPQDGEHLLTVLVVVPRQLEQEFLSKYSSIGESIAAFGGPDWSSTSRVGQNDGNFGVNIERGQVTGSPVVPGSAVKVREEGESVMFAMTLLKGHFQAGCVVDDVFSPGKFIDYVEPLKAAFREKRFVIREIAYDGTNAGSIDAAIEQGDLELKGVRNTIIRWCKSHFGEAYSAYMHLKLVQSFVESVLRYGLPVDFTTCLIEPNMRLEKDLKKQLSNTILALRPELKLKKMLLEEEGEEEEDDTDGWPFVCLRFPIVGAGSN